MMSRIFVNAVAVAAVLSAGAAYGVTLTWDNDAGTNVWSTNAAHANWTADGGTTHTAWIDGSEAIASFGNANRNVIGTIRVAGGTFTHPNHQHAKWFDGGSGLVEHDGDLIINTGSNGTLQFNLANKLLRDVEAKGTGRFNIEGGSIDLNGFTLTFNNAARVQGAASNGTMVFMNEVRNSTNNWGSDVDIVLDGGFIFGSNTQTIQDLYLLNGGETRDGNLTVRHLFIDGVGQMAGSYDATTLPGIVNSNGLITVLQDAPTDEAAPAVPEPATAGLGLLAIGALTLLRRK